MKREYESGFRQRTCALLGADVMEGFAGRCIAIAGLGGVGGAVCATLARMGFGRFRIADPGTFDLPDLNRQWAATHETLGRNKAEAYGDFIHSVNPDADVRVFSEGITGENSETFLEGADLLVEALDIMNVPPEYRQNLARGARERGMYNILPTIIGFSTVIAAASPDGVPMGPFLAFVEQARSKGSLPARLAEVLNPAVLGVMASRMATGLIPSIALATGLVAAVVSMEVVMILGGEGVPGRRDPICLPEVIFVDLSRASYETRNIQEFQTEG